MAAADVYSLGDRGGPDGVAKWIVGGGFALALHAGVLLYLDRAPEPHQFENSSAIEIDMTPAPSEAGAEAPADEAQPAQAEELAEIAPEEAPPPPDDAPTVTDDAPVVAEEAPPEELEELEVAPDVVREAQQLEAVETPPDVQAAVTLPPEETVTAREEEITPPPEPKPVVRREEPKPKPKPKPVEEPKPVVRREQPKPRPEAPKPSPEATRGETAQKASRGGSRAAQQAGRQGAGGGDPAASRAAASAYGKRVHAAVASQKRTSASIQGSARVSFTVSRSGAVSGISASGSPTAAAEAQAMVRRAGIPPMPAEMTGSSQRYAINVNFSR